MKTGFIIKVVLALFAAASSTACLTQRTVTEGGVTVKQDYVIKRPIKEAITNSR